LDSGAVTLGSITSKLPASVDEDVDVQIDCCHALDSDAEVSSDSSCIASSDVSLVTKRIGKAMIEPPSPL
jgi:hypothetical protein